MIASNNVHVTLELDGALAESVSQSDIEERTAADLRDLAATLGLDLQITVERTTGSSRRMLRVFVDGVLQAYPPELMEKVWDGVAPEQLRHLPAEQRSLGSSGFQDAWLAESAQRAGEEEQGALAEYVTSLAIAVVREHPSALLGADPPAPLAACGRLLDFGIDLRDLDSALHKLEAYHELGTSPEDALELLFEDLRPPQLEIRLNPADAETLAPVALKEPVSVYSLELDEDLSASFRYTEESLFAELGLVLPDLVIVSAPDTRERSLAIRINDRIGPPLPAPAGEELLVAASKGDVEALGVESVRPTLNPAGRVGVLVPADAVETITAAGYASWTPSQFLILAVASEIRRRANCLLGVEDVEYRLADLDLSFPRLVEAAGAQLSVEELTRALRRLVAEGVSIWDLRSILERAIELETIDVGLSGNRVFDDRLPVRGAAASDEVLAEFIRTGLKDAISHRFAWGNTNTLVAYLLHPPLEADPDSERLLEAVWSELDFLPGSTALPVILTSTAARPVVRRAIADELPGLGVVSFGELRPTLNVQPVARAGVPD